MHPDNLDNYVLCLENFERENPFDLDRFLREKKCFFPSLHLANRFRSDDTTAQLRTSSNTYTVNLKLIHFQKRSPNLDQMIDSPSILDLERLSLAESHTYVALLHTSTYLIS